MKYVSTNATSIRPYAIPWSIFVPATINETQSIIWDKYIMYLGSLFLVAYFIMNLESSKSFWGFKNLFPLYLISLVKNDSYEKSFIFFSRKTIYPKFEAIIERKLNKKCTVTCGNNIITGYCRRGSCCLFDLHFFYSLILLSALWKNSAHLSLIWGKLRPLTWSVRIQVNEPTLKSL